MSEPCHILIVEDSIADFKLLERHLEAHGLAARCRRVASLDELNTALDSGRWDVVLSDYRVPQLDFEDCLHVLQARLPEAPVILVSGVIGEERAVELLKSGVWGFVLKDNLTRLTSLIERSLQEAATIRERKRAEAEAKLRSEELVRLNAELTRANRAALNLMQDAIAARALQEQTNAALRQEITERKRIEQGLRETEERFAAAFHASPNLIVITRMADGKIVDANEGYTKLLGYSRDESIGKTTAGLSIWVNPADRATFIGTLEQSGEITNFETKLRRKDGTVVTVLDSARTIELQGETCILSAVHDITERKQAEDALCRLNRELRAVSTCNQTVMRAVDEQSLLNDICRIVCDKAGYRMAWVGYAENDEAKTVRPVAWAGFEDGYLTNAHITWAETERGHGPTGIAIRSSESVYIQDFITDPKVVPWREIATQRCYRSSIALPLKDETGNAFGALTIYSAEPNAFTPDEQRLLEELAGDLAFGIVVLRTRTERKRAEEKAAQNQERFKLIFETIPVGVALARQYPDGRFERVVNDAHLRICGLTHEQDQIPGIYLKITHPEDAAHQTELGRPLNDGRDGEMAMEKRYLRPDGAVVWVAFTFRRQHCADGSIEELTTVVDITERKRAEESLRESEARYRALFNSSADGIGIADLETKKFKYVNPAICRMLGYAEAELCVLGMADIHPPESLPHIMAEFEALASGDKTLAADLPCLRKDGSVIYVDISGAKVIIDGRPCAVGFFRDITERKQAEESLRMFQFASDQAADAVFWLDQNAGFSYVNDEACRSLGYTREELMRLSLFDIAPFVQREKWEENWQRFRDKQIESLRLESRHRRKDGSVFPVEVVAKHLRFGGTDLHVDFVRDMTEHKRMEEMLRREQELFNCLVRTIPDCIYFKDRQSRFVRINESMAKLFGLRDPAEAVGKTDFDVFSDEHARQAYLDEQRAMETGEPIIGLEEKETWPDGRVTWVSTTKIPLRDAEGKITGLVGISRDITANKTLEEQLRQSQKMEAFGQLAGGVAHDFNNILAIIQMQAGLLKSAGGLSPEQVKFANDISATVDRAAALTRQLLLFSRKEILQPRDLDLSQSVTNMTKMLRRTLGENIEVRLNLAAQPMFVHADPAMLDQVLLNLAVNARDAMPQGGQLAITTAGVEFDEFAASQSAKARPGSFVCLSVADTGCGIPPEILPRIFEPFFTTKDSRQRHGSGPGDCLRHHPATSGLDQRL